MALNQAPGVKVKETIYKSLEAGTSTTASGFVGTAPFGPVGVTRLTSVNELYRTFGVPGSNDYGLYALERTLTYADEAYFKRVVASGDNTYAKGQDLEKGVTVTAKQLGVYFNGVVIKFSKDFSDLIEYKMIKDNEIVESIGQMEVGTIANRISGESDFIRVEINDESVIGNLEVEFSVTLTGANDVNTGVNSEVVNKALEAFNNAETIDIALLSAPGFTEVSVITKGIEVAEARGECLFVADAPNIPYSDLTSNSGNSGYKSINSDYCALFYPWVLATDTVTGYTKEFPPSVFYASQSAISESNYNPWYSVAGLKRGVITAGIGVTQETNKTQRDTLYGEWGINPIVQSQNQGVVIWGNTTTKISGDADVSVLGSISTRKALNYLKKQLLVKSKVVLFDPNDTFARETFKLSISPVLRQLQAERGISDYYVDFSEMSDSDLDQGILRVSIYIKPIKAVEYVVISVNATASGVDFIEEE